MAVTAPNKGSIWVPKGPRYLHKRMALTVAGTTASNSVSTPPGRLIGLNYDDATGGALVLKAETTAGVQIWTDGDISSTSADIGAAPKPVGTTSLDEGAAATAATDGFSGGYPIRGGVFGSITGGTDTEVVRMDMWFRLCTYVKLVLVAQSGADGTGAVTRFVDLHGPGVLSAISIDYQNMPNTTDIVIKADATGGPTLHTRTSSNTDLGPTLLGSPGMDEAINATAATDGTENCLGFKRGLFIDVAEADIPTSGNELIILEMWIDN